MDKEFIWNEDKNKNLKKERHVTFEDVIIAMASDGLLDIIEHPNKCRYPNQQVFVINMNEYVYLVPFIENEK